VCLDVVGRNADGAGDHEVTSAAGRAARIVVWAAPGAGGAQPIGTVTVRWGAPDAGEATLAEVSWPPTLGEADLWRAIEEMAGHPILR
jgi:hypothetical protein